MFVGNVSRMSVEVIALCMRFQQKKYAFPIEIISRICLDFVVKSLGNYLRILWFQMGDWLNILQLFHKNNVHFYCKNNDENTPRNKDHTCKILTTCTQFGLIELVHWKD